jgi:hypothetical protein
MTAGGNFILLFAGDSVFIGQTFGCFAHHDLVHRVHQHFPEGVGHFTVLQALAPAGALSAGKEQNSLIPPRRPLIFSIAQGDLLVA